MGLQVYKPEPLKSRLESVSERDILARWFGIDKVPCRILSPFREEKHPSFSLFIGKDGKIRGYDFTTGRSYSVMDMVMTKENVDFKEAALMVVDNIGPSEDTPRLERLQKDKEETFIEIVPRKWNSADIAFWKSFGISQKWLEFADVHPVSGIVFVKGNRRMEAGVDKLAFAYVVFGKERKHTKVYQPYGGDHKWFSDGATDVWNLFSKLPESGDKVIITSSLKDALCLWANTGIPACCPQSESMGFGDGNVILDLKRRFNNVYIFYDNDFHNPLNPGQENALRLCEDYNLKNICIPDFYQCKDPSDLFKKYGRRTLRKIVNEQI